MFYKLSTLVALVPLVSALTLNTPENLSSGGTITISWTTADGDPPVFSLELLNTVFHNTFAIANNVQSGAGSITMQIPAVPPGDGYTLEAVNISNVNEPYSQTGGFAIAPPVSTTASPSSTGSVSSATGSSSLSSSSLGSVSATSSGHTSSATSSSASGSGSASSPTSSLTNFNAAKGLGMNTGAMGAMVLGAIAGAAVIAL
ncbi:hypothetical protein EWM64_g7420 [Hericium alpestre]|uniref:Yeast cell wall synthesis Kre9/Knh1-like N-terminal domain-containing protein n=1 Tax=Hericium alpestre TaxID=135208 RepID=A0A4Y9ZQT8_9AGAM|nr:hypothetical protein EWM64_g7420 [Hericium alpestre]